MLALVVCALSPCLSAHGQRNLDFEAQPADGGAPWGWRIRESGAEISLDVHTVRSGAQSLRVTGADATRLNRFAQTFEAQAIHGNRVRISAYVKTGAETTASAALWIRIEGEAGARYFDSTRAARPVATTEWTRREIEAPLLAKAQRVTFGGELAGPGTAWFDDFAVTAVDARTLPAPSPEAARYVERALEIIETHAVVRPELDWPVFYAAVMEQTRGAVTETDGYLAIRFALATLADGHSHFTTPQQVKSLASAPVGNALTGRAPIAPHGEMVGESIGYVRLPGFAGGTHAHQVEFAETVQRFIRELDSTGACGWLLDLRDNLGGNLWPMLAGLGPLLGDGGIGGSLAPDGERRDVWYEGGKAGLDEFVQLRVRAPYQLREQNAPVAVLVNSSTASAGELLAIAFAARPATRSFGTATRGATTVTRTFPLRDGAAIVLAVANTRDRHGRVYTGALEPDEIVAEGERTLALSDQPVVHAAASWLSAHGACAQSGSW
jgi:C-terminal processing protease CtpA/Prc